MKRVAITGYGIADSLGSNLISCFSNMLNEYDPLQECNRYNFDSYANVKVKKAALINANNTYDLSRCLNEQTRQVDYIKLALHSVNQALNTAKLEPQENVAVIFNSLCSDLNPRIEFYKALNSNKIKHSPRRLLETSLEYISGCVSQAFSFSGLNTCVNGACASGLISLDYAGKLVDDYDYVVVGGSDMMMGPASSFLFQQYQALTDSKSMPFDKNRNGFLFGEGAGCLILESEAKAVKRGAKIHGFLSGIGIATELDSSTGVNKKSATIAMKKALMAAGIDSVDFINTHATSTVLGDQIEYEVIKECLPDKPIFSAKGKIGHTMGACGIIEIIYGLAVFQYGIIPKTFNLTDPLANDLCLLRENVTKKCKSFIKNSYGFGGRSASAVITYE